MDLFSATQPLHQYHVDRWEEESQPGAAQLPHQQSPFFVTSTVSSGRLVLASVEYRKESKLTIESFVSSPPAARDFTLSLFSTIGDAEHTALNLQLTISGAQQRSMNLVQSTRKSARLQIVRQPRYLHGVRMIPLQILLAEA